jgi:hypothetical protein
MKGSQLYIIAITAFIILVFLFELAAPKKFSWNPTYDKNDREPFGSYVFDDVLSSSIEDYQVIDKTFFQIWEEDSTVSGKAFLLTEDRFDFSGTDVNHLFKLLHNGNQVMICLDSYSYLEDTLHIGVEYTRNSISFNEYLESERKLRDSIFSGKDTLHYERIYAVYPFVHTATLRPGKEVTLYAGDSFRHKTTPRQPSRRPGKEEELYAGDTVFFDKSGEDILDSDSIETDSQFTTEWRPVAGDLIDTLVRDRRGKPLAVRIQIGKGEIYVVSTPLMFTNFGILDEQNASYVFRLLSYMKGKPLIRIEAYGDHGTEPSTPLRFLLVTPPLRWAIYTAILLILLFMIFTAKRRQRIIPVVESPPNRTLGFIRLISGLFYSRHDNAEILKTKYSVFCSDIKQKTGVDLLDDKRDDGDFARLAEKTGMSENEIKALIKEFRLIPYQYDVPDHQMKELMDKMNQIRNQMSG